LNPGCQVLVFEVITAETLTGKGFWWKEGCVRLVAMQIFWCMSNEFDVGWCEKDAV